MYLFYRNVHCVRGGHVPSAVELDEGEAVGGLMGDWIIQVTVDREGHNRTMGQHIHSVLQGDRA